MKKILPLLLLLATAAAAPAAAKDPVTEYRRTLHAAFGQENVKLEAPRDMCFLDDSDPRQSKLIAHLRKTEAKTRRGEVIAVFTGCYQISQLATAAPADLGLVRWMNPSVGASAGMPLADYLDMRESSLPAEIGQAVKDAAIDPAHRGQDMTSATYTVTERIDGVPRTTTGIEAATLIRDIPVDITLRHTSESRIPASKAELLRRVETMIAQQRKLNP